MIVEKVITDASNEKIKDTITLTYHDRFIRRKKLISDNKVEFLVNLPETISLKENSSFVLENGSFILIKYAKEPLLEIVSENLMKIVWHIGNRHIPCQIELDQVQFDTVYVYYLCAILFSLSFHLLFLTKVPLHI